MIALLTTVAGIAQALTTGQKFATNSGHTADIAYHVHVMPARSKTAAADVMPFCLVKLRDFGWMPQNRRTIELLFCLYNEDRSKAITDITTLSTLLAPLAARSIPAAVGWKLQEVTGYAGDKETGVQPHPEYYLTLLMDYLGQPVRSMAP